MANSHSLVNYDEFLRRKEIKAPLSGTELHPAYYNQAVKNLSQAEQHGRQTNLFDLLGIAEGV